MAREITHKGAPQTPIKAHGSASNAMSLARTDARTRTHAYTVIAHPYTNRTPIQACVRITVDTRDDTDAAERSLASTHTHKNTFCKHTHTHAHIYAYSHSHSSKKVGWRAHTRSIIQTRTHSHSNMLYACAHARAHIQTHELSTLTVQTVIGKNTHVRTSTEYTQVRIHVCEEGVERGPPCRARAHTHTHIQKHHERALAKGRLHSCTYSAGVFLKRMRL